MEELSTGQLLLRAARELRTRYAANLEPHGIAPHQSRALRAIERLCDDGPVRLTDLAEHLGIAPRSATEVVDALEAAGWVQRTRSATDRRAIELTLTDQGRALRRVVHQARLEQGDEFFSGLSTAERAHLDRLLHRLLEAQPRPR